MQVTKMTVKGQVTVPSSIRKRIGVKAGSKVGFEVTEDGGVRLVKVDEDLSLAGILADKVQINKPVSLEEMNEAIKKGWTSRGRN